MITDPPLLTLRRNFPRPDDSVLRQLRNTPTGFVVDCMNGRGALDYRIKALDPDNCRLVAPIVTCHPGPGDNLAVFAALEIARPGDVIFAATDMFTKTCVAGDILLAMARNRGVAGFVTDGLMRDIDGILPVGLPVFCMGITPNSCTRTGPGTAGLPVVMGGTCVDAGEIVVADRDGVVVVPHDRFDHVCHTLPAVRQAEEELTRRVRLGLDNIDAVQEMLNSPRTKYVD
jgi:4-hydroxy-4-methyl-2-oxoglutarate aldolase